MNEQELNKRLAEWAGFKTEGDFVYRVEDDKVYSVPKTDFTESLDACFKWLVPQVLEEHTLIETYSFKQESGLYYSETEIWDRDERQLKGKLVSKAFTQDADLRKANTLALCLAIDKLIEGGRQCQ